MKKFEYKLVEPDESVTTVEEAEEHLNKHGRNGWQLLLVQDGTALFMREYHYEGEGRYAVKVLA